jgi:hypothetical protein
MLCSERYSPSPKIKGGRYAQACDYDYRIGRHSVPDSHRLERQRRDRRGTIESSPQRQLHSEA